MGSTNIESAPAPTAPSTGDAVREWVNSMPQVYQTQMQYAPLQAQQAVDLANQYAGQYGQALQKAQAGMYPVTSQLQEQLATQAQQGMSQDVPSWMQDQYRSNVNAQLGNNANSPIGADYMSRGLLQQQQDWKQYYNNLGLSAAGRQPLTQAGTPATSDYMSSFSPTANMGFMANTYGTSANIFGTQQNANNQQAAINGNMWGSLMGSGGQLGGSAMMAAAMSSARYKRNIKLWLQQTN